MSVFSTSDAIEESNVKPMKNLTQTKPLRPIAQSAIFLAFACGIAALHGQTGPFAPTNWPPTVNPAATVNYGIFDPNAAFTTPAGWNSSVSLRSIDQHLCQYCRYLLYRLGGHTGAGRFAPGVWERQLVSP